MPKVTLQDVKLHEFDWVEDESVTERPVCPECGGETKALVCTPLRSSKYLTHVFLCTQEGCKRVWPRNGARLLAFRM